MQLSLAVIMFDRTGIRPWLVAGAAAQAAYSVYSRSRGPLVSAPSMAYSRKRSSRGRSAPKRKRSAGYRLTRPVRPVWETMTRWSAPLPLPMTLGVASGVGDVSLNALYTTDLLAAYDTYRIKKVTAVLMPAAPLGNGAAAAAASHVSVACACDQAGENLTVPSSTFVASYDNARIKHLTEDDEKFYYTFYPKVINDVDNAGTSTAVGNYGPTNPWLNLSTQGIAIPHKRLLYHIQYGATATVTNFILTYIVTFDVRRNR
ncbi:MAG: hypothetical protein [Cressdnaviricota sp.]|nr:MAG: hypothetical protein [Cressdnaviricota sp.]